MIKRWRKGEQVRYADTCPGEGWEERGSVDADGRITIPQDEELAIRASVVEGRVTHKGRT